MVILANLNSKHALLRSMRPELKMVYILIHYPCKNVPFRSPGFPVVEALSFFCLVLGNWCPRTKYVLRGGSACLLEISILSIIQMCVAELTVLILCVADRPVGQVDWIPDSDWSAGQRCSKRCGRPMREELKSSTEHR